ncbi:MAG: DUF192 domain-containing protein [Bryobacteraceae bacterium]|nr:DUF192 domain-containing protein [Bryobacteraceae bacterium]
MKTSTLSMSHKMSHNRKKLYFPMRQTLLLIGLCISLISCGGEKSASLEDFHTRPVTLPDGTAVTAEVLTKTGDMARGMMFRESLPEGRALMFVHERPSRQPYWMYSVKVPLDIVWLDRRGKVLEISENTPPCPGQASTCPSYGGTVDASIVIEVPGGYGRKHGIRLGEILRF